MTANAALFMNPFTVPSSATGESWSCEKQKTPAFIDRNAGALEIELWFYRMRLYPERSITSHRFCGSGRLFPGLLETETRRAGSGMIRRLVAKDMSNPGRWQGYFASIQMSSHFCKKCKIGRSNCQIPAQTPRIDTLEVQKMHQTPNS
jgi:hypothetical protein